MTGRTIPVTRTDGSEVASEATQELIKAKTDNLDIALSALRDALRGTGNKTLTDLWDELASTLAVSDSTSHTTLASILTALSPLATDAKLEAVRALLAGTLNVSGPLTDTQLRAAAVAISAASLPLPSGAATDAKLEAVRALLAGTLAISAASLPLPSGAATSANQTTANNSLSSIDGGIGGASAAAAGDTGASTTNGFLRWMRDFWLALKGTKTAANSISVTGASDSVFYVGGVSADGVAPTNQAVRVSGVDGGGLKRTLLTDASGRQYVVPPDSYSINSSTALGSLNATYPANGVGLAVPAWATSASVVLTGTFSLTAYPQISFDGGATWIGIAFSKNITSGSFASITAANQPQIFDIPPGVTHIQVKCVAYTSGTAGVILSYSSAPQTSFLSTFTSLTSTAARIGSVMAPGIWYDDTSSALNASATFTSTARDVTATSSGSAFSSVSTNAKEFRVLAEQDVAFTLQIQASRDNSTFRVIQSITATNISGGGYVAEVSVVPKWRYYRYAIVNGGSNAARTTGGSILMAS